MLKQPATNANPDVHLRTMRILWGSFLVCVGMFVLVSRLIWPTDPQAEIGPGLDPLLCLLAIVALTLVTASFVLKGGFFKRAVEHKQPALMQAGFILAMALCEAGVLMGMVGIFVTRHDAAYLLFALGAFGMLLHFPRREHLELAYRKTLR